MGSGLGTTAAQTLQKVKSAKLLLDSTLQKPNSVLVPESIRGPVEQSLAKVNNIISEANAVLTSADNRMTISSLKEVTNAVNVARRAEGLMSKVTSSLEAAQRMKHG